MTKEEILNGMSEEEFYKLYPTEEAYFMAKGGSLSGAPHNGQPTADQFFNYGVPALGHMNIPMGNPTYLAHGGTYFGGPIYPAQRGAATPVPAPNPDAFMAKLDNPPLKPVQFPTLNTRAQYDKFKAGNPNFAKYSDADMQGLGVNVPAQIDRVAIKKQEEWNKAHPWSRSSGTTPEGAQLFHKTGQSGTPQDYFFNTKTSTYDPYSPAVAGTRPAIPAVTMAYGGITEFCWGGGLPGGPNEMPEMLKGGYNSPTNYGSFSVPMSQGGYYQKGGVPKELMDWAANEQAILEARTNVMVPPYVKKYFGEYPEPRKFDSTHAYPRNPNIAMGFKGNKVMLVSKDEDAENMVRKANKLNSYVGPTVKGERDIYFDYLHPHEYGGILDANNNQDYPMMDEGGRSNLIKIIKAAGKKMKKEYAAGGNTTMQGGNQDYLTNMKGTYDNFLKQNIYNSLVDQEQQDISKAFMQMGGFSQPMINPANSMYQQGLQNNISQFEKQNAADNQNFLNATTNFVGSIYDTRAKNKAALKEIQDAAQSSMPKAEDGEETKDNTPWFQKLAKNFPANFSRGYGLSNKDYNKLYNMPEGTIASGLGLKYGPLARALGKTGRNLFGPKEVYMDMLSYNPSIHNRKPLKEFDNTKDFAKKEDNTDPRKDPNLKRYTDQELLGLGYNLPESDDVDGKKRYKDMNIFQRMRDNRNARRMIREDEIPDLEARNAYKNMNFMDRMRSNIQTNRMMKEDERRTGATKYDSKAYDAYKDYYNDMTSGDSYGGMRYGGLPVAATGFTNPVDMTMNAIANYKPGPEYLPQKSATDMFAKQTEADLKTKLDNTEAVDTSSAYSKDRVKFKRQGLGKAFAQYAPALANQIASGFEARDYQKAQEDLAKSQTADRMFLGSTGNRGDYDPNSGMFRPNQMVPVQYPGGMYGAYGGSFQDGGMYEEGEELDLSPEEIEELRNQGYEIEELD